MVNMTITYIKILTQHSSGKIERKIKSLTVRKTGTGLGWDWTLPLKWEDKCYLQNQILLPSLQYKPKLHPWSWPILRLYPRIFIYQGKWHKTCNDSQSLGWNSNPNMSQPQPYKTTDKITLSYGVLIYTVT